MYKKCTKNVQKMYKKSTKKMKQKKVSKFEPKKMYQNLLSFVCLKKKLI